jgi:hypothetical protein
MERISANLYCGDKETPAGKLTGTNQECMRKGIGTGLFAIAPKSYQLTEEQIENEKARQFEQRARKYRKLGIPDLYCGGGVPKEGQVAGTRFSCLKRGIGVGINILAPEKYNVNYLKPYELTIDDIYAFARKLNIPIRDNQGNLIPWERVQDAMAREVGKMNPAPPVR